MRSGGISSASVSRVTLLELVARGRSPRSRRPRARRSCPRSLTGRGGCGRSATAAGGAPSRPPRARPRLDSSAALQRRRVVDRDQPVAALARLVGVDAVVLDQHGAAGVLLAQLQAARGDAEVGVALAQEPAIAGAEAEHDGQRALGVRVGRLELDVAARRGHGPDTSTFRAHGWGDGRRSRAAAAAALDPARQGHAASRVPRDDDRRGADPRLRGDARAARRGHLGRDAAGDARPACGSPTRSSSSRSCAPGSGWWTGSCGWCPRRASGISGCTATRRRCGRSATTRTSRRASRTPRCSSSTRCWPPAARACRRSRG